MSQIQKLAGLTNAIVDLTYQVSEDDLVGFGLKKGFLNSNEDFDYKQVLKFLDSKKPLVVSGGSPGNVIRTASLLGTNTSLFGVVGDDFYGKKYIDDLVNLGVESFIDVTPGDTGRCYILLTPDGEKTSFVDLGVSYKYSVMRCDLSKMDVFHTSGYELMTNKLSTLMAVQKAGDSGALVSFDLADPFIADSFGKVINYFLDSVYFLFGTEDEFSAFTGKNPLLAIETLSAHVPVVILKKGKAGSVVRSKDKVFSFPAEPVKVVNTNGAGDAYAAGFLSAYMNGCDVQSCGRKASVVASKVCGIEKPYL